jgi:glucokinase
MILAGDIGGTSARIAVFDEHPGGLRLVLEREYASHDYPGLEAVLERFLDEQSLRLRAACFGIAGRVTHGRVVTPNLPWTVEAASIARRLSLKEVRLINDLEANAWAVAEMSAPDLVTLNNGDPFDQSGHRAIIAAGTGLGEAALLFNGREYRPLACEGGHADFAPRNAEEIGLLSMLIAKHGHVSYERVLSGRGLCNIYEYLRRICFAQESDRVSNLMRLGDPAAVISEFGLRGECALCQRALSMFVSFYGAAAGNLALKFMATGGVYVGGGIAPKILPKLCDGTFMKSFLDKGRMGSTLVTIPVHVIRNPKTALLGAALCAARLS